MSKRTKEFLKEKAIKSQQAEGTQNQEYLTKPQETQEADDRGQLLAEADEIQPQENQLEEAETQEDSQEDVKEPEEPKKLIDWSALKATKSKAVEKASGEEGVCSIINCKKNGNKRISLASKLLDAIGNPNEIDVGIMPNGVAISEKLPIQANRFPVKELGAKKVIYAGALVEEITDEFKLDYSQRTSITFQKVEYDEVNGYKIALIII